MRLRCGKRNHSKCPAILLLAAATQVVAAQAPHHPVLLISVDGMRPDYVTQADQHRLRIPTLRRIMAQGAYAEGVQGVFPTVTYPSHTTLVTGVAPALHGIFNNQRFDPERQLSGAWFWYADEIQVPTLFQAAHTAGLHTASVSWPVTANADINFLIPEYWRTTSPADAYNPDDRYLMNALSRPDGEVARIEARTGIPYMKGNETTLEGDEIRTRYALDILARHRPEFMAIHLSSLDEEEHLHAPFSPGANADLESLDAMLARLIAQEQKNFPDATIAVVSDHGFAEIHTAVNFYIPFLQAGLIQASTSSTGALTVKSWLAQPWLAGGMAAILLHDPKDLESRGKVESILQRLAADPANGIEAILSSDQVAALGGFPNASFVVTLRAGFYTGSALTGPLLVATPGHGTHGYNPTTTPQMRASFFVTGPGIAQGHNLGVIDMRQIAPTLARVMGVALPSATQPVLPLR